MAAIAPHIGTQDRLDHEEDVRSCAAPGAELGGARACVPPLSATHNGLTRMVWVRRALEDLAAGRQVEVIDGNEVFDRYAGEWSPGKRKGWNAAPRARLYFAMDPAFQQNDIPWMTAAVEELAYTAMIGESGKMACPTWDLPAGSPAIGGSCPGATAGQSVVQIGKREKAAAAMLQPVRLQETICQICYAEGGQYASPHVQLGEILRYAWCRNMLDQGNAASREAWIGTMVRAIQGESFPVESQIDPRTGRPILPMRIHSSGDFYSPEYADAWIEVMNRVPEVMFWAPTRTWAAPAWMGADGHWARLLPKLKYGNLALRPSAYQTDDSAPAAGDHPWRGPYVFPTAGTTSVYKFTDANAGRTYGKSDRPTDGGPPSVDPRYDWPCPTYRILNDRHSCPNATAPDGQQGCRACWLRPDLRVNYTTH